MKKLSVLLALLLSVVLFSTASAAPLNQLAYSTGIQVQNLSGSNAANITLTFVDGAGATSATVNASIAAAGSVTYFPLPSVSAGFSGSAVVSSDQPVAAIVNLVADGTGLGSSYVGRSAGDTSLFIPIIIKNLGGQSTWFSIQNAGTASTGYTVSFANQASCDITGTIPASASVTIRQDADTCLPVGYLGAATITSTGSAQPLVAVNVQERATVVGSFPKFLLASTAFSSAGASNLPVAPVFIYIGTFQTGISLQNTGGSSTDVTITYTPSAGFPGASCTETKTIAAGAATIFGFPSLPAGCIPAGSFVGTAAVTTNSTSQPLVGLVNQANTANGNASTYSMFNPGAATDTISLPLILDRVGSTFYTGVSVMNVGDASTDVTCTFSNTSYTASATLTPGAALTFVQQNEISAGYIGSGTCTTNNGEEIVAMVNELQSAFNSLTQDGLLTYEGVNIN